MSSRKRHSTSLHSCRLLVAAGLAKVIVRYYCLPVAFSWNCHHSPITTTTTIPSKRFLAPTQLRLLSARRTTRETIRVAAAAERTTMDGIHRTELLSEQQESVPQQEHHILSYLPFLRRNDDDGNSNTGQQVRLVLASQSPRRREILDMMGLQGRFQVIPSPLKEEEVQVQYSTSLSPTEYTRRLAEEKAMALAHVLAYDPSSPLITSLLFSNGKLVPTLVLGSDTIVEWNGMILEKPKDVADARNMLLQLSGQQHQVHTGVALYLVMFGDISEHVVEPTTTPTTKTDTASTNSIRLLSSFTDTAWVQFAPLSQQDIEAYLATGEPMDKAGSYGIQGVGGQFVTNITGDFFTVMGLPAHRTSQALAKAMSDVLSSNV